MKITTLLTLLITAMNFSVNGQAPIGHTTITFNDPARTGGFGSGGGAGRQIQSEIYYPAAVAGNDVAVAAGSYPVIIFGHGFVMAWDAYENIWSEFVPKGYIMVFPRTEGGFSPSHQEFGLDLALLVGKMQDLNATGGSLFENSVASKSAIMGHSMGGGASFLAAENNTSIETVIGLAPAETTPSAITAASNVTIPALIFSGSSDGVTPPVDHHEPIYGGLSSACKYFISITGGAHCYFANSNFNCDFGEGTSSSGISITREEQHQKTFDYLNNWLDFKLKSDCPSFADFQNELAADTEITYQDDCNLSSPTITASDLEICSGETVTISSGTALDWNTSETGNSIIVDTAGTYFGQNANCAVSNLINIQVFAADSIENLVTLCQGETVTVGTSTYTTDGVYYDDFTSVHGCDSVVMTVLTVTNNLDNSVSTSLSGLTANQTGVSYQWLDCDNNNTPISGATSQIFEPSVDGNYAVIIGNGNCSVTSDCNAFELTSSVGENEDLAYSIYPVPATDYIFIEANKASNYQIFTVGGQLVQSGVFSNEKTKVDLTLPAGIYLIKIALNQEYSTIQKLIINP